MTKVDLIIKVAKKKGGGLKMNKSAHKPRPKPLYTVYVLKKGA